MCRRLLLRSASALGLLVALACMEKPRTPTRLLVPKGYVGWVRVEFEVTGAAPVPRREGRLEFRIPPSGVLATSDAFEEGSARDEYFYYSALGLKSINLGVPRVFEDGSLWGGSVNRFEGRTSLQYFVGTRAQYQAWRPRSGSFGPHETGSLVPLPPS